MNEMFTTHHQQQQQQQQQQPKKYQIKTTNWQKSSFSFCCVGYRNDYKNEIKHTHTHKSVLRDAILLLTE